MAITITSQPTADGVYSAYFPIKITATETGNPDYLYFLVRNHDGTAIDDVPWYKANNIGNVFTFDAAAYLKAVLDVRTTQGLSTTNAEVLTDSYGYREIIVNTTASTSGASVSNHFYYFAMIGNKRYSNDETANYAINYQGFHYSDDFVGNFTPKTISTYDRVTFFNDQTELFVDTYAIDNPNDSTAVTEALVLDITVFSANKLLSIPLNETFIATNFLGVISGTAPGNFTSFRVRHKSLGTKMYYHVNNDCNVKEFVFVNRYGAKENISFKSSYNEEIKLQSDLYQVAGFTHTGNTNTFNTSADSQKINQEVNNIYTVEGNKVLRKYRNSLIDFLSSPLVWLVSDELIEINIYDGTYKLSADGKGLDIKFKYAIAQDKNTFI
jgi:hypothetical protein